MSEPISVITNPARDQRERNTYLFSVGAAILFVIILLVTLFANQTGELEIASTGTLLACIVSFAISAFMSRRGMSTSASLLMIGSLILFTFARVFITRGLAIPSGIINIIVVTTIAVYTLPRKWVNRVMVVAAVNAAITIFLDQITTGIPTTNRPEIANIISIAVGVIYLFILLLQFPRLTLRSKLIVAFISLTALPIVILGYLTYSSTHDLLEDEIQQEIERVALSAASDYQEFVDKQLSPMQTQANSTELVNFILLPPEARPGSEQQQLAQAELDSFKKNSPTYIRSYSIVDLNGISILDTNAATLGNNYSDMTFFKDMKANKEKNSSGLATVPGSNDYVIYFSVPILTKSGDLVGMYVRIYNANVIQSIMDQIIRVDRSPGRTTQYSYIIDEKNFFILAHSVRVDLNYKTYLHRNDRNLLSLIQQGLINPDNESNRFLSQTETVDILTEMGETGSFTSTSPVNNNENAESSAVRIRYTDWILVTSEPTSVIASLIQDQTRNTVVTSILLMALAALLALLAANFFTKPITELTQIAQSISAGNFNQKATIRTRDEIGLLADSINVMSEEIQQSIEKLESRVERRTADLSLANQQSEKRAQNLQIIAEISRIISTEKDQEKLLSLITQIVSEKFGFYHVGIFLLDENKTYAVLRAANSAGGQEMLMRKHSLKVGQTGIVGYVTSTGTPRIALDTGADAVFFNNPSLPETHSEMALPLITRGSIIGALDVQSKVPNAFTDADISIISILADQVSIAIDNSRLLEAAQASIEETRAVFSEYLAEAWQKKTESGVVGYRQTLSGGQVLTHANMSILTPSSNGHGKSLEVPIRIREQTIGVLNIRPTSDDHVWSDDDMNVIEAVTERLGLALDNARLFEETSTRATRERLVADITTKIRSSNDPQEMIRTAMEELKQVLGASKVEILPNHKSNHSSDK
jgi:GAF domain-containing protein/HAMP domain-containing protein